MTKPPKNKGTTIAKMARSLPAPAVSEATAIITMIERAARDPACDLDKMQRLLDMRNQAAAQAATVSYMTALSVMQAELPMIQKRGAIKDGGGKTRNTYALWEDINETIRPYLAAHGFSMSFRIAEVDNKIAVTGILGHRDGHSEQTTMTLPIDTGAGRNLVQSHASSVSYGKRYTATALLNLTSSDEVDDDGAGGVISEDQAACITERISVLVDGDAVKYEKWLARLSTLMGVSSMADLPASKFDAAMDKLNHIGAAK